MLRGEVGPSMRLIRGLAALVVLVLGLAAVPAFLVILVGNPLPAKLGCSRPLSGLTRPDDGTILIGLITVMAWTAWLVFALSVVVEVIGVLSRQRVRVRLPGSRCPAAGGFGTGAVRRRSGRRRPSADPSSTPQVDAPAGPEEAGPGRRLTLRLRQPPKGPRPGPSVPCELHPRTPRSTVATRCSAETTCGRWPNASTARDATGAASRPPTPICSPEGRTDFRWGGGCWSPAPTSTDPTAIWSGPVTRCRRSPSIWADPDRWSELFEANRFQLADADQLPVGLGGLPAITSTIGPRSRPRGRRTSAPPRTRGRIREVRSVWRPMLVAMCGRRRRPDRAAASLTRCRCLSPSVRHSRNRPLGNRGRPATCARAGTDPAARAADRVQRHQRGGPGGGRHRRRGWVARRRCGGRRRARRRVLLQARPVGRRIASPPPAAQLAEAHLGRRQRPMSLRTLDLATRAIAAHSHHLGVQPPELALASVSDDRLVLELAAPSPHAPAGFRSKAPGGVSTRVMSTCFALRPA